jgi:hypothetical protein
MSAAPATPDGRRWWRPAPIEIPESTECRGCGRRIELAGLKPRRRFYCKVCAQMMRTTPQQFAFRFTPEHQRRQRNLRWLWIGLLMFFPVWCVDAMTRRSPSWQELRWPLTGMAWAVGLAGGALFRWLRPVSNDIQYWGGILLLLSNGERMALNGLGLWLQAPFVLPPPWFGLANGLLMLLCLPMARRIWRPR